MTLDKGFINTERELYTPIYWDCKSMKFIPTNFIEKAPMYEKEDCLEMCKQLTAVAAETTWKPSKGDTYYTPVYWTPEKNFCLMNNQADFDECPYPAFKTSEECQTICDKMNRYLSSHSSEQDFFKIEKEEPVPENTSKTLGEILRNMFCN